MGSADENENGDLPCNWCREGTETGLVQDKRSNWLGHFPLYFAKLLAFFTFYLFSCHDLAATWGKRDPRGSGLVTSPV